MLSDQRSRGLKGAQAQNTDDRMVVQSSESWKYFSTNCRVKWLKQLAATDQSDVVKI